VRITPVLAVVAAIGLVGRVGRFDLDEAEARVERATMPAPTQFHGPQGWDVKDQDRAPTTSLDCDLGDRISVGQQDGAGRAWRVFCYGRPARK
jgi:hypothetical protein